MVVLTLLGVGWLALERGEQGRRQGGLRCGQWAPSTVEIEALIEDGFISSVALK